MSLERKRIIIVALICALVMNMAVPVRQADAVAPVIVAGAAVGTFVGVVAIGAIAMDVFGMAEQSDQTMAFAEGVWLSSSQWAKDQVMASYNAAVAAGDKVMTLSADVASYFSDQIGSGLSQQQISGTTADGVYVYSTGSKYGLMRAPTDHYWIVPGGYAASVALSFTSMEMTSVTPAYFFDGSTVWSRKVSVVVPIPTDPDAIVNRIKAYTGVTSYVSVDTISATFAKRKAIKDAFPLSLPLPMPNDFIYTPVANPGVDVKQVGDQLVDDAGKVYQPDQVKVKVAPKTQVLTDAAGNPALDASGKPIVAVPVGATKVGAPAIPGDLVNVRTGEKVTAETGTANPPLDWASQPTTRINWEPLKMTGSALTKVFPFSIPWDVYAQLKIFDVTPQTPVIKVNVPNFFSWGSFSYGINFNIDLSTFDPVALAMRWIGNIVFTIGLALAMRRFMPQ